MFVAVSPTGASTHLPATFMGSSPSGATGSPRMNRFKPGCPTAIRNVAGQAFVARCPSGAVVHSTAGFQGQCPTSAKTP
jgi:hypothetical protein